jgi:hypothetical protein
VHDIEQRDDGGGVGLRTPRCALVWTYTDDGALAPPSFAH